MQPPRIALDQHGLFSRSQALQDGWSRGRIDRALAAGIVVALAPGVYVMADLLEGQDRRSRHLLDARALVQALGDHWYAARRTAAVLHGLPLLGLAPSEVQLTRPQLPNRGHSASRHRRIHALRSEETVSLEDMGATSLARTVFDLARDESFHSGVVVTDAAFRSGLDREQLLAILARSARWPGVRRARAVVAFADGRAESPLESLGRVTCLEEGLPVFEPEVEVWVDGELIARVDGLWREALLVFEGDGALKLTGRDAVHDLVVRQERLRDAGLDVVRASWADVTHRRSAFAVQVRGRLAARGTPQLPAGTELVPTRVRPVELDTTDHYRWPSLPSAKPRAEASEPPPERGVA